MRTPLSPPFFRQKGLSLVELMIALTLGLLILVAVGTVFTSSRQSFSTQEAMARMQEGARYAFELMTVDIRQAGFTDCAPKSNTYSTLDGTDWFNALATQPLLGFESGAGLPADVTSALANTDALKILRADNSGDYRIVSHDAASAQFQLAANHDLKAGEILTVVDASCSKAVVFQQTNTNNNNTVSVVVHNTGTGTPGNSTKCLDDPAGALCSNPSTYPELSPNSRIMRMSGNIYYLRNNPAGEPALYRKRANTAAEELVEGVENMQITYGEDTTQASVATCPEDGCSADAYVKADAAGLNWNRVVSVRLTLSMRTPSTQAGVGGDGRIRKTFETTIAVRNRL